MLCSRCGATNAETAPSCGNCGAPLKILSDLPAEMNPQGRFSPGNSRDIPPLPIEQMPTAQVPSVPRPSPFEPVSHIPFHQEPLPEPLPLSSPPAEDAVTFPPPSQAITPPEHASYIVPSSDLPLPLDVAEYPTETSIPVPVTPHVSYPDSMSSHTRETDPYDFAGSEQSDASSLPSQSGAILLRQPGMISLPSRPKTGTPFSKQGISTPPSQPITSVPPSQPGIGPAQADVPYTQPGPGRPPSQPGGDWQSSNYYQQPAPPMAGGPPPGFPQNAAPGRPPGQAGIVAPSSNQLLDTEANKFIRPLPRWLPPVSAAVIVLLLVGLTFLNPDWATGATIAGMVALIAAILVIIATGVRVALGMLAQNNPHLRAQLISTALLLLLFFLLGGVGISQQANLHTAQARYFEGHHNWQAAISEFQAAGETNSASQDVARLYNEWGEEQSSQQRYSGAVANFSMVIQNYQQATEQFSRAKSDIIAAYLAWADQASQQQNYLDATAHYNALLLLVFCTSSCQSLALPKDATAYYHLAEQQLAAHQFAQAVNSFQTLKSRFLKAPEVNQIHADYAKALWGLGQQQLTTTCSDAVQTYRLLGKLFADTSQGQQAATALQGPVQVKGHFTQSIPGAPYHPTAFLVQGLVAGIQQFQFPPLLGRAPTALINNDGTFSFKSVPQGTYELIWSSDMLHFYYATDGKKVLYTAHLGPLCTYNYGDIDQAIPTKAG